MAIDKNTLSSNLLYSTPYLYKDTILVHPVRMDKILEFQVYTPALTVRKDSRFPSRDIIRMSYLDFLIYSSKHPEVGALGELPQLHMYYIFAITLLQIVCPEQDIKMNTESGIISINGMEVTSDVFEDLRRIIILQNGIEFDPDEFLNYETEKRLEKASKDITKTQDAATIEDYIDALCVALHLSEDDVYNMSIRKFWRLFKRYSLYENYQISKTAECSGMVKFKEPVKHWVIALDNKDKYSALKASEQELRDKISG